MSQITKSVEIPVFGPRWANSRTMTLVGIAMAGLIVAGAMASWVLRDTPATSDAAMVPAAQADSRLDDYGLRHPAPFGATTTTDSRLDDYGLRHPAPFGATTTTDSRLDDYGLRHPAVVDAPTTTDSRLDDYGLRHPTR